MFIESNMPRTLDVGGVYIQPFINQVDNKVWNKLMTEGYEPYVNSLIAKGELIIHSVKKPTVEIVKKTYDMALLKSWESDKRVGVLATTRITEQKEWLENQKMKQVK